MMPPPMQRPGPVPPPSLDPSVESGTFLVLVLVGLALGVVFALITAVQAQRRGYSLVVWLLAGAIGYSLFLLVLLGMLPDFRRKRMRATEMDDLRRRLGARPRQIEAEPEPPPTAPPGAVQRPIDRSLGDQPTRWPDRSLGDNETRL